MKSRPTQFGVRENTASLRQYAPRLSDSPRFHQSCVVSQSKLRDNRSVQRMSPSGGAFRLSLSEGRKRATGEVRRDTSYPAITAREYRRQSVIAPLRTQLRAISKAKLDLKSTAEVLDGCICVPSTHELNHEQGGLP